MLTTLLSPSESIQKTDRPKFKITTESVFPISKSAKTLTKIDSLVTDYHLSYDLSYFISKYLMNFDLKEIHLFNTRSSNKVILNTTLQSKVIVNFKEVNTYRRINRFFEDMNTLLPEGGLFIASVETHTVRKNRILAKIPKYFRSIFYTADFIYHRIVPKIKLLNWFYFYQTNGRNRVLTKAETLGRLYACGFSILEDKIIDGKLHFIAKKQKDPSYDCEATYGPLIQLKRVGLRGKVIRVFKFRTMHPYAEYLQQYVYDKNSLSEGGKMRNDFRISRLGRAFRKYWIDEIPMLFNLIKGDLKLIGTRPLSKHYFNLYPKSLQEKRTKYKPGLLPPFYADMPKTLDDIIKSEQAYLNAYEKQPLTTDLKYFVKIVNNILFGGKRSA